MEPFKPDEEDHRALLRQLWGHAFPSLPFTTAKSSQWKEMGWQVGGSRFLETTGGPLLLGLPAVGYILPYIAPPDNPLSACVLFPQGEDPATDIRGAGRLGLECLLYLATESGPTWDRLLGKLDGERSDWEYPFAVAGINITFMLLEVIGLQQGSSGRGQGSDPARSAAGRGFAGLTAADDRSFEELFVATFEILDREWLRQRASYMQFNTVIKAVRGRVVQALGSQPKSINELRQQMLGGRQ